VALVRTSGEILSANRAFAALDPERLEATQIADHFTAPHDFLACHQRVAQSRESESFEAMAADRSVYRFTISPVVLDDGTVVLLDTAADVTAQKQREDTLRRTQALLVDTHGVAHLGTWEWDVTQPHATWSDELYRIYALTAETYTPSYEAYLTMVHPEDREAVRLATEAVFRDHTPYSHDERIIRPDGSTRYLHTWAYPVLGDDGKLVKLVGVCQDITDRKLAENALAERARELALTNERLREEMLERERIEARLRQTHKLEAIGRLAGGIAHDFNNLLGVIVGQSSHMQGKLAADDRLRENVTEIMGAGRLAARLVQQLLAFSRGTPPHREVLDLSRVVSDLTGFLQSAAGAGIELVVRLDAPTPYISADRSQIEQVVINLAVNARDAMPDGGRLTVEIADMHDLEGTTLPEELDPETAYIVLAVSDTGIGMAESTIPRVFDPYFTTKEQGTGLGLSTVYGIAHQSGGAVVVESTEGKGTRVLVFFPRTPALAYPECASPRSETTRSLTILLVEDQVALRLTMRQQLLDLGHAVLDFGEPLDALAVVERGEHIDLLLTDIVMPRISGLELAERVREARPETKVLFVSGWAESMVPRLELPPGVQLLHKPFTSRELATALETTFDSRTRDVGAPQRL
jgi:signal transduction histidine kinase/ActR/RegA family two-component response regulator